MNPSGRREPWQFASLSPPRDGSFVLPLSARVAQSPPPPPAPSAGARMKSQGGRGRWDTQDSQALLSLLDDGWYVRNPSSGRPALKTSKPAPPRPASSSAVESPSSSSSGFPRIPAVRPLNLASLRDHNSGAETPTMASARSTAAGNAVWRPASASAAVSAWADTPRSFVTAASLAASLPQNPAEIEALPIEEVASLAEEAEALQQAAAKAAALARARLRGGREPSGELSTPVQAMLQIYIIVLGLLSLALLAASAVLGTARRWRAGAAARVIVDKAQRGAYFAAGAVAGAVQGLRAFTATPPAHSLT